jgi:hypothetical protein
MSSINVMCFDSIIGHRYREPIMSPSVSFRLAKAFDDYEEKNEAAWRKG